MIATICQDDINNCHPTDGCRCLMSTAIKRITGDDIASPGWYTYKTVKDYTYHVGGDCCYIAQCWLDSEPQEALGMTFTIELP